MANKLRGNAVVGQSGGPTAVINQSLVGVVFEASKHPQIENIYGARHGVKGILGEDFVDLKRESIGDLEAVANTPASALGSVRQKPTTEECARIFEIFRKHDVRYFFYIGGNDSAEAASIINDLAKDAEYEFRTFHVPKTIDNDLLVSDHTPGFGSAARFIALATMGDDCDNRSLPGIKVNILMGRKAGFLTAATMLARQHDDDGPHLVYPPECTFSLDKFLGSVAAVYQKLGRCLVCVGEGVAEKIPEIKLQEKDSHGNVQLSGSGFFGDFLANQIKAKLGAKRVRADTYGYLQRSFAGCVSEVDAFEARRVGEFAVRWAVAENVDGSVAIRRLGDGKDYAVDFVSTPLETVARNTKSMPADWLVSEQSDISEKFRTYALPLVGELPRQGRLAAYPIKKK
ncbi:MAG: 6-phosphofructokinase [Deltaproteobacteria bacterium]|nr:6-phosphofructokinase [Deltaproteobacteria bacterium]